MTTFDFTLLFAAALLAMVLTKLWLASRQIRFVSAHKNQVPAQFTDTVALAAHQRAADYTIERTRLSMLEVIVSAAVLIGLTLLGGVQMLEHTLSAWLGPRYLGQIALIAAVVVMTSAIDLPFDYYRQFVIEERFGFNRMTKRLFVADLAKGILLSALLGLPLLFVILWLMNQVSIWWLWAWVVLVAFQLLVLVLYPTLIAPLFNTFTPLSDDALKNRIEALMKRCGFAAKGLFVMDGSRRSAHGNAYFTGFGAAKRIVFFDTLLARLTGSEIEAVLAHELGHFKHRHVIKRMVVTFVISAALFALLGWLAERTWFYAGLGVNPLMSADGNHGLALVLFFLALPVFMFFVTPLSTLSSRKHEFEADAFAASQTDARALIQALVKLYEDNASTLTPDPLYTAFYYSHPPASQRIERLLQRT